MGFALPRWKRAQERLEYLPRDDTSLKHLHRMRFENDLPQPPDEHDRTVVDAWCRALVDAVDSPDAREIEFVSLADVEHETRTHSATDKVQPPPRVIGDPSHAFHRRLLDPGAAPSRSTDMTFHRLGNVRLLALGSLGPVVLDERGRVIRELSTFYAPLLAIYEIDPTDPDAVTERRTTPAVALLDRFWELNYAHWLLDGMPRLLGAGLFDLERFDAVTTRVRRDWQRDMLQGFGVPPERHLGVGPEHLVAFDRLVVSEHLAGHVPHPACKAHGRAVEFLASAPGMAAPRAGGPDDVLVIVRTDNRRLENTDELVAGLSTAGFRVTALDTAAVAVEAQRQAFAAAPIVVAVHGAALANTVFMTPGSLLVELMPPSYGNPEFWMLACARRVDYACVTDVRETDPEVRPQQRSLALTGSGMRATIDACLRGRADAHRRRTGQAGATVAPPGPASERLERLPSDDTSLRHLNRLARQNDLPPPPGGYDRTVVDAWCRALLDALASPHERRIEFVSLADVEHETRAHPGGPTPRTPPRVLGEPCHAFGEELLAASREPGRSTDMVFHRLEGARLTALGSLGPVVLDERGRVIRELSTFYAPLLAIYEIDPTDPDAVTERRTTPAVALLDRFWELNYAHWLLDGMPRLLGAGLFDLERFDAVTTRVRRDWQRDMLQGFGVPPERHLGVGPEHLVAFDQLVVADHIGANLPHPACRVNARAVELLASRPGAAPAASPTEARDRLPNGVLVIVRTDNRRLENTDELVAGLLAAGFHVTLLDGATVPMHAQWEAFASAPIVIAVHGASLANTVFMTPGSLLVELMPPSYGIPSFWMLAYSRRVDYACVTDVRETDPEVRPQQRSLALTGSGMRATIEACVADRDRRLAAVPVARAA